MANSNVQAASVKSLEKISDRHGLQLSQEALQEYTELINTSLTNEYRRLDELADIPPEVKYPRTPGYRPSPEENTHNAWYYKTCIKGAETGKLAGKRIAIKDSIFVAGVPLMNGSQLMEGFIPDEDATVVTRILDAGGCIVGKANCENLCYSGSSDACAAGAVLNPVDKTRIAGGSSSGSACLVKLGEADMSLGADQGGSIRIPSSWCGTVGIKATHGLVPYTGAMTLTSHVDHVGPIAMNVKDLALLLEVIAGVDKCTDPRQPCDLQIPSYSELLSNNITGKKIGWVREGFDVCKPDVVEVVKEALGVFRECGANVEEVSVPLHKDGVAIWTPSAVEAMYKTLFENFGSTIGSKARQSVACIEHLRTSFLTKARAIPPSLAFLILLGNYTTDQCGLRYLAKSINLLPQLTGAYDKALNQYDVLVMPTLPFTAPELLSKDCSIKDYIAQCFSMVTNTAPFDITGHPALSINAGLSGGLPVGLQIIGKHWDEQTVLNVAYAFEQKKKL